MNANVLKIEWGRLKEIDTMKGIGIVLMVMGHCEFFYTH